MTSQTRPPTQDDGVDSHPHVLPVMGAERKRFFSALCAAPGQRAAPAMTVDPVRWCVGRARRGLGRSASLCAGRRATQLPEHHGANTGVEGGGDESVAHRVWPIRLFIPSALAMLRTGLAIEQARKNLLFRG